MIESSWLEIDLRRLDANVTAFRSMLAGGDDRPVRKAPLLCAVVKADAYGHGAVPVAQRLASRGVDMLAVFNPEQGRELVENGIETPILVMGFMAEDIVGEFHGIPLIVGKEGIRGVMASMLEAMVGITRGTMTIVVSGDGEMAYQFGTSTAVFAGPNGEVEDPQKFLFVWRKLNGEWKVVAGASSSDVAM